MVKKHIARSSWSGEKVTLTFSNPDKAESFQDTMCSKSGAFVKEDGRVKSKY